ncbi:LTA synthase family protein [Capnocytophaga sputigena]|uniref:LTA synthase family protein n=1 Tax=Capnocytophaga sputigena TaxID=1019 RepID=UPI0028D4EAE0|nr:sulfatase-like hydrolase/transferase [Capnocytophaga sputigena]
MKSFLERIKPFAYIAILYLLVSFVMRAIFMLHPITTTTFSVWSVIKMITIGLISDVFTILLASSILAIYLIFIANVKYKKPYGGIILGIFILILLYIQFYPNNIFAQYGGVIPEIALAFFGFKAFCFALLLFFPKHRVKLRNILYFITLAIYVFAIVMNAVSEYFFWNEFGIRYNFIAVDYLIYTNEVIGNIMESYPVVPLFSAVFVVVLALTAFLFVKTKSVLKTIPTLLEKAALLIVYLLLALVGIWSLPRLDTISAENTFAQEIQSNGVYKFYYAFTHSELDFFQFYPTLPEKEAESIVLKQLNAPALERQIVGDTTEVHHNVLLISIESLSAEYLTMYGNTDNRTPFLDSLANNSLFFTNLYATGNRTVRGLEALTLCIPPTPGESVVKRKDNKDKFTTGSVFKSKGYDVKYLYGGDSYFDNMKDFFSGNGYDIVDSKSFAPEEVTFSNIWGVCDEDMANKAIKVMNEQAKSGKPFFNHWMTVSNHRPFTYPEGKIDIPPTEKRRAGGVKYTDYALKRFFEMAKQQKWYKNTIFVIVADHCASSAGSTELPLDGYRIPCFIVADFITPKKIDVMMSQIDVMPTVMGLLNFSYTSKFIGQDVLKEGYQPRAYIATYQDLGYLTPDKLTIISPLRKTTQYSLHKEAEQPSQEYPLFYEQVKENNLNKEQADACIGTYQATAEWLKNKQYNAVKK